VSTHIEVSGQHDSLLVNGNYTLNEPNYNGTPIPTIKGGVSYSNDSLFFHAWVPSLDSSVYANASLPLRLSLGDEQSGYFQMSDDFQANLNIDSLKITSPEMSSYQHMEAGAYLQGSLKASGKLAKPQIYGQLKIDSAFIYNQKQGVFYQQIDGVFTFKDSTVNIDTLLVLTDKGYLAGKGEMVFDSTIISGKLRSTNVETNINGFDLLQHNDYKVNISGNPYWKPDNDGHPSFGGKVSVNRSSFNLPSLIKTGTETGHKDNVPLLLQAIQEEDTTIQITREVKKKEVSPLLNQMRGRLTIDIPRATWLKGDDMNIEISGDFDIAKSGDYFELFGDVEVVRGYYILYGRKFNIEKGVITFTGGETPDPRLEITAEYTFRSSDKEKHILRLSVGGILSEPEIAFTLDDDAISESDAVSIMIFGKTMDELSYVGQNGIVGSVGSNMLANMITSSLNSTIGQRFKLDMIEVNSTENWQSAAFVVGKYITNDLFVIYQRGFGETEDDEITPETITLEYELSKLLFFRLQGGSSKTSGFDVILKIESSK
ncbi:MAG: translocation/assembly module TamB, partial [Carboxylicivirga sp.]|nr:translocation/assembly module TamB [Carboxylicivirga sp.]